VAEVVCVGGFVAGQRAELSFGGGGDGFELGRERLLGSVCGHDPGLLVLT
jgi:hypothetical protein